jgi:hypothetical protein
MFFCVCLSFARYFFWSCMCGIFPIGLGVFCMFLWCPCCLLLFHICVLCNILIEWSEFLLLFLNAYICSLYLEQNDLAICHTYLSRQLFCIVFWILNAIFNSVSLNNFIIMFLFWGIWMWSILFSGVVGPWPFFFVGLFWVVSFYTNNLFILLMFVFMWFVATMLCVGISMFA